MVLYLRYPAKEWLEPKSSLRSPNPGKGLPSTRGRDSFLFVTVSVCSLSLPLLHPNALHMLEGEGCVIRSAEPLKSPPILRSYSHTFLSHHTCFSWIFVACNQKQPSQYSRPDTLLHQVRHVHLPIKFPLATVFGLFLSTSKSLCFPSQAQNN